MVGERSPVQVVDKLVNMIDDLRRRVHDIELILQKRKATGFRAIRSTNASAIAAGGASDITWSSYADSQNWSAFAAGSTITVPATGAGVYAVAGGMYWVTSLAGIFVMVTVNGFAVAGNSAPLATADRAYVAGVARLAAGDVIRLRIANTSGSSVTPTAFAGDTNTPVSPFLAAWRIGT